MMMMMSLYVIVTLATVVVVGGFHKIVFTSSHRADLPIFSTSSFNSAGASSRELDQPLEILKERSTKGNSRELNKLATRLISRCSSHHHLRKCYEVYEYLRTICEPDSRTQTALMSAYIRYASTLIYKIYLHKLN